MITLASAGMERQLDRLWRNCFYDPVKVTRYFFKYRFVPDNTPVAVEEKEVVSALFLLPCKIRMDGFVKHSMSMQRLRSPSFGIAV